MNEPLDIDHMREVAETARKATGAWRLRHNPDYKGWHDDETGLYGKYGYVVRPGPYGGMFNDSDAAEHVALFDPPTVLALLDRLDQLRAAVAADPADTGR